MSQSEDVSTDLLSCYIKSLTGYGFVYNNQINARTLIGHPAMVYCAGKPMEKLHVFWIII